MTFVQSDDAGRAPSAVAELVKGHKLKMRSVEEVLVAFGNNLDGILTLNENAWHMYAHFLVHIYPKPQNAGWGWSRVGGRGKAGGNSSSSARNLWRVATRQTYCA